MSNGEKTLNVHGDMKLSRPRKGRHHVDSLLSFSALFWAFQSICLQ